MSSTDELMRKIREGNQKIQDHQNEIKWWLIELSRLNRDLEEAQQHAAEEARRKAEEARQKNSHN